MSNERKRQKKREQQKKKREAVKTKIRKQQGGLVTSSQAAIRQAALCPFGPAFVSPGWDDDAEKHPVPQLVTVVITRKLPDNRLVVGVALVDRTCLGIKDGFAKGPMSSSELAVFVDNMAEAYHDAMEPCDPLLGQSIVFHAIDFARSLGFSPHSDFPAPIFGPRPNTLIDTPHARPAQPIYISGPRDNAPRIMAQLEHATGPDNFALEEHEESIEEDEGDEEDRR